MQSRPAPGARFEVDCADRAEGEALPVDERGAHVRTDAEFVHDRVGGEARVVADVLEHERLAPDHDMRTEAVLAAEVTDRFRVRAVRFGDGDERPVAGLVESREELPVLADEVHHRVGRGGDVGDAVGERVELRFRALPETQQAQPLDARGGALVLRGQQQSPRGHARAPGLVAAAGESARR